MDNASNNERDLQYTLSLRRGKSGAEKLLTIPGHSAPARDVAWIALDDEARAATFASCSHDQARPPLAVLAAISNCIS